MQCSLSRVLFDGPSLAKALYMVRVQNENYFSYPGTPGNINSNKPTLPYGKLPTVVKELRSEAVGGKKIGNLWLNFMSTVFNKPFGLGLVLYDMEGEAYGGVYIEGCALRQHNFGIQANQTVLAESASLVGTRIVPINPLFLPS